MTRIQVLGIGSPFGDDRAGWRAVEALRQSAALEGLPRGALALHILDRPGVNLIRYLAGAERVIIVDAARGSGPPGTLRRWDGVALLDPGEIFSSHGAGVAAALRLAAALGPLPDIAVHGIEVADVGMEAALSQPVAAALPRLIRRIETEIREAIA